MQVDSLLPPSLRDVSLERFWEELPGLDGHYAGQVADARRQAQALRYLAIIRPDERPWVGLKAVPADSVLASTRGTESLFMFRTDSLQRAAAGSARPGSRRRADGQRGVGRHTVR